MAKSELDLSFDSLEKSLDRFKKDIKFALYVNAFWNTLATILTVTLIFKFLVFK